ncbi:MAG: alpha/beta fold hydrolase [Parachlamydia sp.]|nr:alpha/beta fold hydrolase [Parachlamydia sp.]
MKIYAIHGFLGQPSDWGSPFESLAINDFPHQNFTAWSRALAAKAAQESEKPFLMGYSLGGRLALHALIERPDVWRGGIIISAHPGLPSRLIKKERLVVDELWAERFEKENWELLMQLWENQNIFKGSPILSRAEIDYQRPFLSACLRNFSLGKQKNLRKAIEKLPLPLLWMTGELDSQYTELADSLAFSHPGSSKIAIKGAGHRVPGSQPLEFHATVQTFISQN